MRKWAESDVTTEVNLLVLVLLVADDVAVVETLNHHPGVTLVMDPESVGVKVRLLMCVDTQVITARGYPLAKLAELPQKCDNRNKVNGHGDPNQYYVWSFHKMKSFFSVFTTSSEEQQV